MRYLIHFFDSHEHLRRSEALVCNSDDVAIAAASARSHPYVIELWQGDRRVWRADSSMRDWLQLAS